MIEQAIEWISVNYIEVIGAILGVVYIFFSIRQNIFTWPTGLLTSALYVYVFFVSKFYADMGLQFYYVFVSIYGWYFWLKGGQKKGEKQVSVSRISMKLFWKLLIVTVFIYVNILFILLEFTDSPVPFLDSMTTALSIIATWMLARKIIEHWIIWIFVDAFSAGLYAYKDLWATCILFIIYTGMAVLGFIQWKKDLINAKQTA